MKNFLFINPQQHIRHPPLGLGYLASFVNAYYPGAYRFRLVDYAWQSDRDLEAALAESPPDLVGLTSTTNSFAEASRLAALVKSRLNVPVIIGGVHITAVPEDLLGSPFDVAVLGEGEETFLDLLRHFDQTGALKSDSLPGLAYQEGHRLVKTPPRPLIADLDKVPQPDYSLFAMREHYTRPRALAHGFYAKGASLMPSRGCPYGDCSFCGSNLMWQRRVRFFSPQRVFQEMQHLVETYGLNSIIFLDDNFTTNRAWLAELAALVRGSDFFPYFKFDCESIAEFLDDDKTAILKSLGCERIEFGFESGCQRVLSELKNQKAKLAKSIEAIDLCHKHGIKVLGNFIFGWFDETADEILETYDFIQQHPMDYVAWHTLAPYPGTRAWRLFEARARELKPDFSPRDFYNMETCNTHLPLNPGLNPAQARHLYGQMRREAYQGNTQIIHEQNLTAAEKAELWQAFNQDMARLQVEKPRVVKTRPNPVPASDETKPAASLPDLCRGLETALPRSTRDIMADFDLLAGHPWEHHAQSPATTYYACLSALASHSRPRRILEIGTGFGLSAAALLSACDEVELFISLDLGIFADHYHFPENNQAFAARKAHAWCKKKGIPPERVRFFKANTQPPGKSDNDNLACQAPHWRDLPELLELLQPGSFDVLFVDGKHTEDGLYQDMLTFWEFLRPGGLLLCDDLHDASYRDIFPWAGDTLTSFQRFTTEQAGDIQEHHVWPYPRVLPENAAGLRPFGLIMKKGSPAAAPAQVPDDVVPELARVIHTLARSHNRLYFRDQTPASLAALVGLAEELQPTRIVELGTCQGLSLRAWLMARTKAQITAVDLSFGALKSSLAAAPVDLSRVTLMEQNILTLDFSRLWGQGDRVLLYIDAHDQPGVPIMARCLEHALPALPQGSLVVVDDLWHSPAALSPDNAAAFFQAAVLPEIDPLQCFPGHYASYWQGGAFMGFAEAIPLLTWVNRQGLPLMLHPGAKLVSFGWPPETAPAPQSMETKSGAYFFNPVKKFALAGDEALSLDRGATAALSRFGEGVELFARGKVQEALEHFMAAAQASPHLAGAHYAQAVCLARLGRLEQALPCLDQELAGAFHHARTLEFQQDLHRWLAGDDIAHQDNAAAPEPPTLTIFAIPKAFEGHTGIIQRNALTSWTRLTPRPDIILFGRDPGTAEVARELNLRHVPDVAVSDHGTPLVKDLFDRAGAMAKTAVLAYVNADIILGQDFLEAAAAVRDKFPRFLMVGQRHDLDITAPLNFDDPHWHDALKRRVDEQASLHAVSALDYFVFTKGLWPDMPESRPGAHRLGQLARGPAPGRRGPGGGRHPRGPGSAPEPHLPARGGRPRRSLAGCGGPAQPGTGLGIPPAVLHLPRRLGTAPGRPGPKAPGVPGAVPRLGRGESPDPGGLSGGPVQLRPAPWSSCRRASPGSSTSGPWPWWAWEGVRTPSWPSRLSLLPTPPITRRENSWPTWKAARTSGRSPHRRRP